MQINKISRWLPNYISTLCTTLKKVVGASILDLGEVIESDHAAIRVVIEWKGVMGQRKKREKAHKRCLNKQKWKCLAGG